MKAPLTDNKAVRLEARLRCKLLDTVPEGADYI